MNNTVSFSPYETKHLDIISEIAPECTLFLKRTNNDFPIVRNELNEIGLYGNGVRYTAKSGTGSGNVDSHVFYNIENIFEINNVKVISKDWLNHYDKLYKDNKKVFINKVKQEAKELKVNPSAYSVGYINLEKEYDLSKFLFRDKINIYVLTRCAGEGHDRTNVKGDYQLTDTEIRDIIWLQRNSTKFLLVINSATPVDLSPIVEQVDNILLLSLLGNATSETLYKIVIGEQYPSGKLSSTWDVYSNCPSKDNFGDMNDTYYQEGIFVGYRYYSTKEIKPMFPFGYGLSYTDFDIRFVDITNVKDCIKVNAIIKNVGSFKGKEVLQLYLSKPSYLEFYNSKIELVSYIKTKELLPGEEDVVSLEFNLSDFPTFEPSRDIYFLLKGVYLISLGNSSCNNRVVGSIELKDEIVLRKVRNISEPAGINCSVKGNVSGYLKQSNNIELTAKDFTHEERRYQKYVVEPNKLISDLDTRDLIQLSMGNIRGGLLGMIGDNCISVMGGAGETCLKIKEIPMNLVMADGPAGLRLAKECIKTKNGRNYKISTDPLWKELNNYMPKIFTMLISNKKNALRKGERYYQYTSNLPCASALSSSFNDEVIYKCGEIVKEEMELFNVDIWLAPAMNIIRNPLCGRNFEYFSEDPYLTSRCAINMVKGVQNGSNKKVCIKHFACNNQETNRTHSNSIVDIRTLREIYLSAYEKVIAKSNPFSVMVSYNLLNGEHTSQSLLLCNDILRNEFLFKGLIMTDWISSGDKTYSTSKNESCYASKILKAGVNLIMPGNKKDIDDLTKAIKSQYLSRNELINNCAIIYNCIKQVK